MRDTTAAYDHGMAGESETSMSPELLAEYRKLRAQRGQSEAAAGAAPPGARAPPVLTPRAIPGKPAVAPPVTGIRIGIY